MNSYLPTPAGATVSVVIPTFQMGWCVASAIESVLQQEQTGVEVVVVDDGSTDDTAERLQPYSDRVVLLRQANAGLSAARNAGLRRATGEFIVFLDADDRLLPGKLRTQVQALQARPDIGAVYSDGWLVSEAGDVIDRVSARSTPGLFTPEGSAEFRRLLLRGQPPPVHCLMARRSAVLGVGPFDDSFTAREDLEFWLRFSARHAVTWVPGTSVVYTVRAQSMSRSSARMHTQSLRLYERLRSDAQFARLPAPERAACLRAWAIEVGVRHHGAWARGDEAVRAFAREARDLDPANWRSRLLPWLLASPLTVRLSRWLLALWSGRRRRPAEPAVDLA